MKKVEVMGIDTVNASRQFAVHGFEFEAQGVKHYIDGTLRAEVPAAAWTDYCAAVPEAADADSRLANTAQAAAPAPVAAPAPTPAPAPAGWLQKLGLAPAAPVAGPAA